MRLIPAAVLLIALAACQRVTEPTNSEGSGRRLSVGESTVCALDPGSVVYCWGSNSTFFEYGSNVIGASPVPVSIAGQTMLWLSGGWSQHKCGAKTESLVCWGRGGVGQLGGGAHGATGNLYTNVAALQSWKDVWTGRLITCGINTDDDAFCWGRDQAGELGDPAVLETDQLVPHPVSGGIKFTSVVPGWLHTCGLTAAGAAYCWGSNTDGQLGSGPTDAAAHPQPQLVPFSIPFKKIALTARGTCAITTDGDLYCWGYNGLGQLGDGTTTQRTSPTLVSATLKFTDVAMTSGFAGGIEPGLPLPTVSQGGYASTCGVVTDGSVYCWGWNAVGQLGDGTPTDRLTPTKVLSDVKFDGIALGGAYACATSGPSIYCWGSGAAGQLGNGSLATATAPVKVQTPW
jgi:alpha-tubulin suppressor-like RCC1 family protein